jgi:hypothetical protein
MRGSPGIHNSINGKIALTLAAALAVLISLGVGWAAPKKPPSEPLPPGFIYYSSRDGSQYELYQMRGDGSDKTLVIDSSQYSVTSPSHFLHGGMRWFLRFQEVGSEVYPDGEPKVDLFAMSENGDLVQLSDSGVQPGSENGGSDVQWAVGDTVVSWLGRRWAPDGSVLDLGIYYVALDADVAAGPTPAAPVRIPIPDYPSYDGLWPSANGFGWSPDGSLVVFGRPDSATTPGGMFVADVWTGADAQLSTTVGWRPRWSPDGTRIAFYHRDGIDIIHIDESGTEQVTLLTSSFTPSYDMTNRYPTWSPDGNYLCYQKNYWSWKKIDGHSDVYVIPAEGGEETNLTRDVHRSIWVWPVTWSDEIEN